MKTIKYLNTFALGLPLILFVVGIAVNDSAGNYIAYALYSTIITGFIQVVLGIILFIKETKNKNIVIYLLIVFIFFLLWYLNVKIIYSDYLTYFLFPIPLLLATYLSIIIYTKKQTP
jgi:hypothetical protein